MVCLGIRPPEKMMMMKRKVTTTVLDDRNEEGVSNKNIGEKESNKDEVD